MTRYANGLVFVNLLMFCSGCVAAALVAGAGAGVGTYSYVKGELTATYSKPMDTVWPKALAAVESLKLTIDSKEMDSLGGNIEARRSDGTKILVRLKPAGDQSTTVGVRIGTFGNKEQSERIHAAIRKQLGVS